MAKKACRRFDFAGNGQVIEVKKAPKVPEAMEQMDVLDVVAAGMNPRFNRITEIKETEDSSVVAQLAESWE